VREQKGRGAGEQSGSAAQCVDRGSSRLMGAGEKSGVAAECVDREGSSR